MNPSEQIRFLCEHRAFIYEPRFGPLIGATITENGTGYLQFTNGKSAFADWSAVDNLCELAAERKANHEIYKRKLGS